MSIGGKNKEEKKALRDGLVMLTSCAALTVLNCFLPHNVTALLWVGLECHGRDKETLSVKAP